jgi:hypothetical protein
VSNDTKSSGPKDQFIRHSEQCWTTPARAEGRRDGIAALLHGGKQAQDFLFPHVLCGLDLTTDGVRACSSQHAVEYCHADGGLGLLHRQISCAQARADQRLIATHSGLDKGSPPAVHRALPGESPLRFDHRQMSVALRWCGVRGLACYRCRARRNRHDNIGTALRNVSVSGSRLESGHSECEGGAFVRTRAMRWKTRTLRLQRRWAHVAHGKRKRSGAKWSPPGKRVVSALGGFAENRVSR